MTDSLVIVISRGLDDERSSVAWSVANGGIASDLEVLVFLVSSGIDWARRGADAVAHPNPADPPIGEMIRSFIAGGGKIQVCPPCAKVRGYATADLVDGVIMAGAPAMLEWVKRGAETLSF